MKKLFAMFVLLTLTGAGCAAATPKTTKADGGVFKTGDVEKGWSQAALVQTAKGIGTLSTTNILQIEMDPEDNNMLYVGTREDGFLYSEDAGASWRQPRNKDLATGLITSVEVSPKDVCTVYVVKGARLYKTTNCMRSFQSDTYVESRANVRLNRVAVDWFHPDTVWIGLSNGDVQKSNDGGKTWSTSLHAKDAIVDILISNADSRSVLVATAESGIQKTMDGGTTWKSVNDVLRQWDGSRKIYTLVQTNTSSVIMAASQYGLLRSRDFGSTWDPVNLVTSPGQVEIRALAMNPANGDQILYATVGTLYRSSDGGSTWQTSKFPSSRIPRAALIDPKQSSVLYMGVASETK